MDESFELKTQDDIYQRIRIAKSFYELWKALHKLGGIVDSSKQYPFEELMYYIDEYKKSAKKRGIDDHRTEEILKAIPEIGGLRGVVKRLTQDKITQELSRVQI